MFNQNYQTQPHYDAMNSGRSAIVSFGDYEGGELVVEGGVVDTYRKLHFMEGSKQLHWNNPITTGTKYSIVFFSTHRNAPIQ
jgi:predicted 2-oxoglutarate/Fe(II)-dependent dioxygenase YbiX